MLAARSRAPGEPPTGNLAPVVLLGSDAAAGVGASICG
jgi:hypothetical protein